MVADAFQDDLFRIRQQRGIHGDNPVAPDGAIGADFFIDSECKSFKERPGEVAAGVFAGHGRVANLRRVCRSGHALLNPARHMPAALYPTLIQMGTAERDQVIDVLQPAKAPVQKRFIAEIQPRQDPSLAMPNQRQFAVWELFYGIFDSDIELIKDKQPSQF